MKLPPFVVTLVAVSGLLLGQETHVVRATGEATSTVRPDQAIVSIGVVTTAPAAADASTQNAKTSSAVLHALQAQLGPAAEIKTTGYSISPEYLYPQNMPPKLTGYRTTNSLEVKIKDISLAGKVIEVAEAAGANDVGGVSFTLRDDSEIRAKALAEAASRARQNAGAIASALNLHVKGVLQAESSDSLPQPVIHMSPAGPLAPMAVAAKALSVAPILPGEVEVHATVVVTLSVD